MAETVGEEQKEEEVGEMPDLEKINKRSKLAHAASSITQLTTTKDFIKKEVSELTGEAKLS